VSCPWRYCRPADNRRSYRSHRYEVWSPSIERGLTLYGERALRPWVAIEADLSIRSLCERPYVARVGTQTRVVDFWVARADGSEEFWFVVTDKKRRAALAKSLAPFALWSAGEGITTRVLMLDDIALTGVAYGNWSTVLRDVSANWEFLANDTPLLDRILDAARDGCTITGAQAELARDDPELVRAGLYLHLHRGALVAPTLTIDPFDPQTRFVRP